MIEKFYDGDGPVGRYLRTKFFSDYSYKGVVVEVGGGPAELYSFSKHYIDNGWRGIILEPNDRMFKEHQEAGHEVYQYAVSNEDKANVDFICYGGGNEMGSAGLGVKPESSVEGLSQRKIKVDVITLNTFFKQIDIKYIDIMSVDVEGWEPEVLEGLDTSQFEIRFIVLENFFDKEEYRTLMREKGYEMIFKISFNEIYQKKT
jgi:FkbM family methyltransferase